MPKVTKLSFKGDKALSSSSAKKRLSQSIAAESAEGKAAAAWKSLPDDGWINAEDLSDLKGPLMLIFRGRERIFTLSSDADSGTVLLPLSDSADTPLSSIEPLSVQNVVTAHPLPNNPNNYSLKTAHGTFLGCDSFGVVSSDKIAVGPQEEWTPLQVEGGGFSFQSVCYQTFLHAQEDSAGQIKSYGGVSIRSAGTVRCDSQTVGVRETWLVKCQAAQKKARLKKHFEIVKREKGAESAGHIELDQLRRFHSLPAGHELRYNPTDRGLLSDAQSKGHLNETLLESRIKMKSDKYCK